MDEKQRPPTTKVKIRIDPNYYLQFLINLKYDKLARKQFFYLCIQAYMDNNPLFRAFLNEELIRIKKLSRRTINKKAKDNKVEQQLEQSFPLSNEEIESIFDILGEKSDV